MASRFAAIDIGTNTILMIVADFGADGAFRVVTDRAEIARLGEGVDRTGSLSAAGIERALEVLRDYLRECHSFGVTEIAAVGTSALRDARNAKTFIDRLKREFNLELKVLTGAEEAAYAYLSVQRGLSLDAEELLVVDVGGGSTEFIWAKAGKLNGWASLDLGSVRLTERYLHSDPVRPEERDRMVRAIDAQLKKLLDGWGALRPFEGPQGRPPRQPLVPSLSRGQGESNRSALVGIAGTFTTLAAVEKRLRHYSHSEVHGSRLSLAEVERQAALYESKTLAERKRIAGLEPKRADVILAGTVLIERIMRLFHVDDAIVSDQGIRYGLLHERMAKQHSTVSARGGSASG
jgi:exopolyphosphatase/guanosine-5'-triphosphate,3'-diphosphate pyrophosphatase